VTLTFDLDLQTRPSEGRNTSSVWIWRKSVQRFPRYFIHKQKTHRLTAPKTEPSAVHCRSLRAIIIIILNWEFVYTGLLLSLTHYKALRYDAC